MKLGERLKLLRGDMSQDEFAKILGVSQPTIGKYEKGSRSPDAAFLQTVCSKLGITADWLILGAGDKTGDASPVDIVQPVEITNQHKNKTGDVAGFEQKYEENQAKGERCLHYRQKPDPQNMQQPEIIECGQKKLSTALDNYERKYLRQLEENNRLLREQIALERELATARARVSELERELAAKSDEKKTELAPDDPVVRAVGVVDMRGKARESGE